MQDHTADFVKRLAKAIAVQFGESCEVAIHDLKSENRESTIIAIENGSVTNRKVGDGPSHVVLEALNGDRSKLTDHLDYLTQTYDGKIIKSSTVYIRDEHGEVEGIFSINYDITKLLMADSALKSLLHYELQTDKAPEKIPQNVNALLDELIESSVRYVGKPVALMNKEDKIKAIRFLDKSGAFLITKSGDKVSKHFCISKYTLYNYLDLANSQEDS